MSEPWNRFRRRANSLFGFQLAVLLLVILTVACAGTVAILGASLADFEYGDDLSALGVVVVLLFGFAVTIVFLAVGLTLWMTNA